MVYSIGEALIDIIPQGENKFFSDVGGAPTNVVATVAKFGGKSIIFSKVGNDENGNKIILKLKNIGVNTKYIYKSDTKKTGKVFIANMNKNNLHLRKISADRYLKRKEIATKEFCCNDYLHFCSVSLIKAPVRYAHDKAIKAMIKKGGKISFDINMRLPLWRNQTECKKTIKKYMRFANILKISYQELSFLYGAMNFDTVIKNMFFYANNLEFVVLSLENGTKLFLRNGNNYFFENKNKNAADTTGAGDCFIGSILFQLDKIKKYCEKTLVEIVRFAMVASSLQIQRYGAISSLPSLADIENILKKV